MIYLLNLIFSVFYMYFFRKIKKFNFLVFFPIFFLWFLIIGFQYGVGTDYFNYLNIFYDENYLSLYYRIKEYLFFYYVKLLKNFFLNGQSLFIMTAFLENLLMYFFIKKLVKEKIISKRKIFVFIFLFLCYGTNFYNQMNGLRQYFNIYLLSFALINVYDKEYLKYIINFFIGVNIHRSFMYLFPIFFIKFLIKKLNKKFLIFLLILSFAFNFISVSELIKNFLMYIPRYRHYVYYDYFAEIPIINKITKFVYIPFYFLAINLLDKINDDKKLYVLKIGVLAFIFRIFCLKITVLNRVGEYFVLFSIFPIYFLLIESYKNKKYFLIFILVSIIVIIFSIKVLILPQKEYLYKSYFLIRS